MDRKAIRNLIVQKKSNLLLESTNADVVYYMLGDLEEHKEHKQFIYDTILKLAGVNKVSPVSFIRLIGFSDFDFLNSVYDILQKFEFNQKLKEFCDYTGNAPISTIQSIKWWIEKGFKFSDYSVGSLPSYGYNAAEKMMLIFDYQPELYNIDVIIKLTAEKIENYYEKLFKYINKEDAKKYVNEAFINKFDILLYLEKNFDCRPNDPAEKLKQLACRSYDEFMKGCKHYNIDSDSVISDVFVSLEDDELFNDFFAGVLAGKGKTYLKEKLIGLYDTTLSGENRYNLRTIVGLYEEKKLAKTAAGIEYDMFCECTGRCSFNYHLDGVMKIIKFYKTYVPEWNVVDIDDGEKLNNFVEKEFYY